MIWRVPFTLANLIITIGESVSSLRKQLKKRVFTLIVQYLELLSTVFPKLI